MKLKNKLLSALFLSAASLFASPEVKSIDNGFGIDFSIGAGKINVETPDNIKNVSVRAVDSVVYNIENPSVKCVNDLSMGANFFYNFSELGKLPLKVGIRLDGNFSMNDDYTDENEENSGSSYRNYVILGRADWGLPDGRWPKVGVYCDLDQWNLINIEKGIWQSKDRDHLIALTGELNYLDVKWKYFATKKPYGDDWNNDWISTIKKQGKLSQDGGLTGRIGLKYINDFEKDIYLFGELSKAFNINTDFVNPNFHLTAGASCTF
jgi:hypothetical protein